MTETTMPSQVMDKKILQIPEGNVVDTDEEWDRCGKWMLHHPRADVAFLDRTWTVLQPLLEDGTLIMLKSTTALVADVGTSVYCFTRPGKQEAKRAANAISALVDFHGIMYYKLNRQESQEITNRYGDGRASITCEHCVEDSIPRGTALGHRMSKMSKKILSRLIANFVRKNIQIPSMMDPVMPSKVLDRKYLQMPEGSVVESDEEWNECGKWIIQHPHGDMRFVDSAWIALQRLLGNDGTLILLKASTRLLADETAGVLCYTRPGKEEAKRAAVAIRREVPFTGIMYYKLNEVTYRGISWRNGDRNVSMYMQTLCGEFYVKRNNVWIQDDYESRENVLIQGRFIRENYSGYAELPSAFGRQSCWKIPFNHECKEIPNWFLFCDYQFEDAYLSEMHRVWMVSQQLLEEGLLDGVTLKICRKTQNARMRFYVSKGRDVYSWLPMCDRIFKESACRTVMYFIETLSQTRIILEGLEKIACNYKYTSSGELYRTTKYSDEYMFVIKKIM